MIVYHLRQILGNNYVYVVRIYIASININNNKYLCSAFPWNNSKYCVTYTYEMNNLQTNIYRQ